MRFSSDDKLGFRWSCIIVKRRNKEQLNHLIHANQRTTTKELCVKLNGFSVLEMMHATLGDHKVIASWVPQKGTVTEISPNTSLSGPAVVKSRCLSLKQIFMSVIYRLLFINSENGESRVASM